MNRRHHSPAPAAIRVEPVTSETWEAFCRLFEAKGGPHYCWCTSYRVREASELTGTQKKAFMQSSVERRVPIGVLACQGDEPVGWCSVAPRETYVRLQRSRTMSRVTPPITATWTILCFFVARPHRHRRVAQVLLAGAVAYARQQGAEVVEGYPFDTSGVSSTHRGHSRMYRSAGFELEGKRWSLRLRGRSRAG